MPRRERRMRAPSHSSLGRLPACPAVRPGTRRCLGVLEHLEVGSIRGDDGHLAAFAGQRCSDLHSVDLRAAHSWRVALDHVHGTRIRPYRLTCGM